MADDSTASPAAGWYPDPAGTEQVRWWNGETWTDRYQFASNPTASAPYAASAFAYPAGPQFGYAPSGPVYPPAPPVGFLESISKVVRNYAVFTGVASRSEFWYFYLATILAAVIALVLDLILLAVLLSVGAVWPFLFTGIYSLATLGLLVPSLAVTVRRLRDAGYPWPWIFVSYIPFIGGIWLIIILASEPTAARPAVYAPQY
ncbi:DUF805 domain-containing protein [Naasia lichenicola]|uniref:DUF805 domain-containing protein n=1 Tax=Naasia lichenicola TaxID=2565933 RepID=A0A4S4FP22_9MICO|nr:DUF805 domain-containing protein [Naasia lichenicola]THG30754.1 DUF805 domain-containing protein [Naasia lichenicola]THG31991.1 DUF805 domain-containing protein [Naasia lichenicola]